MRHRDAVHRNSRRQMRTNLERLYGTDFEQCDTKHKKNVRTRCLYVREHLSADCQIEWARTNVPKSWPKSNWDEFTDNVWKVKKGHGRASDWPSDVVDCLDYLSNVRFRDSADFKEFCKGKSYNRGNGKQWTQLNIVRDQ